MMNLFQMMTGGHYPSFFECATQAFSAHGPREGAKLLDQLFGSDEVSRQVAQQAAQVSGVGTEILNQILPLSAAILAGGIAKTVNAQGAMLGPMAGSWQKGMTGQGLPETPAAFWTDAWQQWMQAAGRPDEKPKQASLKPDPDRDTPAGAGFPNPFAAMMAGFMSASLPEKPAPEPEPEPEAPEPPSGMGRTNPADAWSLMMETGRDMQAQHIAALQGIFDSVWGRPAPEPGKRPGPKRRK
jgi:hypothetical protein